MQISSSNSIEKPDTADVKSVLYRYLYFWPLLFATTITCLIFAWFYIRHSIPVFQSNATLLVQDNKGIMDSPGSSVSLDQFSPAKAIENEIEVLRSKTVMREVVKNLSLYAPVYQERKRNTISAYALSPVKIEIKNPEKLVEQGKVYFNYDFDKQQVLIANNVYPLNKWIYSKWGIIRFNPNRLYKPSKAGSKNFFYVMSLKNAVNSYLSSLQLSTANKLGTIINLEIYDEDPRRGEDILNEIIRVYKQASIADKNALAEGTLSFLEKRLDFVTRELDSAESVIEQFKAGKGIVDIPEQGKIFLGSIENNEQLKSQFNTQLAVLNQVEKYLTSKNYQVSKERPVRTISEMPEHDKTRINNIKEQLKSIQSQLEQLPSLPTVNKYKNMNIISLLDENRKLSRDNTPEAKAKLEANKIKMAELENQVTSLDNQQDMIKVREELINQKIALENRLGVISKALNNYDGQQVITNTINTNSLTVPSISGLNDEVLTLLLQNLYEAENQYEKLKSTTAENNPILVSLRNQIERIKPDILENISSLRNNFQTALSKLSGTGERYSSELRGMPAKERELFSISRQQVIKNNLYKFLLQKREEAALSLASTVSDSRLVDSAESGVDPVSPNKPFIYAIALMLGLGIGIGIVFLKDVFDKRIYDRHEIEELSSFPIIGEIPYAGSKKPFVISDGERTFAAEQIRQLRTSLSFIGINKDNKKVLVTSSVPGEGKSFIASNLAISLALTEKKVVLVELDLRKPRLGQVFEVAGNYGISDYLRGNSDAEQIIKQTQVNNKLYLIPAGTIPLNPTELLLNGRLEKLLDYLDKKFDYIIIETAPVTAVTDAYIISQFCDATLYVIREGLTSRASIKMLDDNTKLRELKNPAIIYNGIKQAGLSKYGYAYTYSARQKGQVAS